MAILLPFLKTALNTKSDCMASIRQRVTKTLETGPNNLPLIWCSENRSGSLKKDIDRYGRIVGMVYVGDVCVNEALVESGLAWVYRKYCKMEIYGSWLELESMAIDGDIGLWSHPNPVPPWEYRRNKRS